MKIDEIQKIAKSLKTMEPEVCGIVCHKNIVVELEKIASRGGVAAFVGDDFTRLSGFPVVVDNDMRPDKIDVYKDQKHFDMRVEMINSRKLITNKEDV